MANFPQDVKQSTEVGFAHSYTSVSELLQTRQQRLKQQITELLSLPMEQFDQEYCSQLVDELLNHFRQREHRYANNSWLALEKGWRLFQNWCLAQSKIPLPATVPVVLHYIEGIENQVSSNTMASYLWTISVFHRAAGLPDPTIDEEIKTKLSAIRLHKAQNRQYSQQAAAFRERHLDQLISLWRNSPHLLERRNLALLTLAYESMLRESELAAIRLGDIHWQAHDNATLTIPLTKTNRSGKPEVVALSGQCCAIVQDYIELAQLDWGDKQTLLFQPVARTGLRLQRRVNQTPLTGMTIDRVFSCAYYTLEQHNPALLRHTALWSGHSARVGACQDLLSLGYSVLQVQKSGRWRSSAMVYHYGQGILSEEGAMAQARRSRV